jgi:hypothetical protein
MPLDRAALYGLGITRGRVVQKGFMAGVKFAGLGLVQDVAMIGFQANKVGRGGLIPAVAGQGLALGLGIPLAGIASAALCTVPGIGPLAAAVLANLIVTYPEVLMGNSFTRAVRSFTNINKNIRHLEMGGNYKDTELAERQRFLALQDMNAARIPSRRYLGQEALLLHR